MPVRCTGLPCGGVQHLHLARVSGLAPAPIASAASWESSYRPPLWTEPDRAPVRRPWETSGRLVGVTFPLDAES